MPEEPKLTAIRLRRTGGDGGPSCPPRVDPEEAALTRRLLGLLDAVASGDRDAFTEFYRATSHRVFGLARGLQRRPPPAAEVTHEGLQAVW
ncbi:hypothetical protein [Nocardia brasiliensis]|uniref:hypothetical protein n=1 Tax=Nocardia brasiliensis TaxID=37326 RepID=UPI002458CCB5|nr:hypothetical protein [Nocardia brasiliensis]